MSVSSSIGIRYLPKDNKIDITSSKSHYDYIYFDYNDFENSGDEK